MFILFYDRSYEKVFKNFKSFNKSHYVIKKQLLLVFKNWDMDIEINYVKPCNFLYWSTEIFCGKRIFVLVLQIILQDI